MEHDQKLVNAVAREIYVHGIGESKAIHTTGEAEKLAQRAYDYARSFAGVAARQPGNETSYQSFVV